MELDGIGFCAKTCRSITTEVGAFRERIEAAWKKTVGGDITSLAGVRSLLTGLKLNGAFVPRPCSKNDEHSASSRLY